MIRRTGILWLFGVLLGAACSGDEGPQVGREGYACPNDNNCIPSLRCIRGVCTKPPADYDAGQPPPRDAGPVDTGLVQDAGAPDAGNVDAGPVDMGPQPDAGCLIEPTLASIQTRIFGPAGGPHCNQAGCHDVTAAGGVDLSLPAAQLHAVLLGPTQDPTAPQQTLVVPNQPDQSRLYVIMSRANPGGNGGPMPPNGLLGPCELDAVRQWILDGAANN